MAEQARRSIRDFIDGVNGEIRKVTFPTRDETVKATLVTMVVLVIIAVSMALMDLILNQIMSVVF